MVGVSLIRVVDAALVSVSDGSISSSSLDTTVRLWDVDSATCVSTLSAHVDGVTATAVSPNGTLVASGSRDGNVLLWNLITGRSMATLRGHTSWVRSVAFSPDSLTVVSSSFDGTLRLWRVDGSVCAAVHTCPGGDVLAVAYCRDGRIAYAGVDRVIRVCQVVDDGGTSCSIQVIASLEGHGGAVRALAFSTDGTSLASGGGDMTVLLWTVASGAGEGTSGGVSGGAGAGVGAGAGTAGSQGRPLRLIGHTDCVTSVCYTPDGTEVASGSYDNTIRVWHAGSGRLLATVDGHTSRVTSVQYSPSGQVLASGAGDCTVRLWNVESVRSSVSAALAEQRHRGGVLGVCFAPDGGSVASGSTDNGVRVWDVTTGSCRVVFDPKVGGDIRGVAYSPDGTRVVACANDGVVREWDVASGQYIELRGHVPDKAVYSACFSPNGRLLATGSQDGQVLVWDVSTRDRVVLRGSRGFIFSVCFTRDGKRVVAASGVDRTVWMWDLASTTLVMKWTGTCLYNAGCLIMHCQCRC